MAGSTKLLTAGGGGVILTPASSIASDVTVNIPSQNGTLVTSSASGSFTTSNFNSDSTFGFKNRIINGQMAIAQRGTSFSNPNNVYTLDRWLISCGGTAVASVAQVAGPTGFRNALQVTGVSGNTQTQILQRIESYNCSDLSGATVTIQANIAVSSNQTILWYLQYANSQDAFNSTTYISSGTWSATSTATTFTATVTGLPSGATNGLQLIIFPNNAGAFTSGTITITGVQLEKSSVATSFDFRSYGTELALCQRYYEVCQVIWSGNVTSATSYTAFVPYAVDKRASPTITSLSQAGILNGSFGLRSGAAIGTGVRAASWGGAAAATISAAGYLDSFYASAEL